MSRWVASVGGVLALLCLAVSALGQGKVQASGAQANPTDKVIVPPLDIPFSPADIAFREAMSWDASFGSRERAERTQAAAVDAWRSFLERDDATGAQRVFAWWRIGSLYGYNFDRSRGEKSDPSESARAFERVWQVDPDLISPETLNTCTVYATIPGSRSERVSRMAKAYKWLASRTEDMMTYSAARLGAMGYAIDAKFFPGGAYRDAPSVEQQFEMLKGRIEEVRSGMDERIAEMIRYSRPSEKMELLAALSDVADAETMARWQAIECRFRDVNDRSDDQLKE
jgi:hypothetical protein